MKRQWPDLALTQRSRWKAEMMRAQRLAEAEFTRAANELLRLTEAATIEKEKGRVWS
jgi:hypothetical protein